MSFSVSVERFSKAVRGHWRIENSFHWTLDVTFVDDESRVRKDHAPTNFSLIRKLVPNTLRADIICKKSLPQKMITASFSLEYLESLLKLLEIYQPS